MPAFTGRINRMSSAVTRIRLNRLSSARFRRGAHYSVSDCKIRPAASTTSHDAAPDVRTHGNESRYLSATCAQDKPERCDDAGHHRPDELGRLFMIPVRAARGAISGIDASTAARNRDLS